MVARTVKLTPLQDQNLRRLAQRSGITYGEAARRMLDRGLAAEDGVNMLEALSEHVGCVAGPTDLSTNKDHLIAHVRR